MPTILASQTNLFPNRLMSHGNFNIIILYLLELIFRLKFLYTPVGRFKSDLDEIALTAE